MYKLGLKLWSINTDYYYAEALRLYEAGIYDYIELYVVPDTLGSLDHWLELEIPFIIHAPHFAHGFNLAKQECAQSNLKLYRQVKEYADALMAEYIIFHGGIEGNAQETAAQLAAFAEPRALIENKPFRALPSMGGERCRGATVEEIELIKAESGCGFCFDFGHALCSAASQGIEAYAFLESLMQFAPNMYHLTDVAEVSDEYDKHWHLGTGAIDYSKIKELLPENAIITLETDKDSKENLNDYIADVKFIRQL